MQLAEEGAVWKTGSQAQEKSVQSALERLEAIQFQTELIPLKTEMKCVCLWVFLRAVQY